MAAQLAGSIVLSGGPQSARQLGGNVVLSNAAPAGASSTMRRSGVSGVWHKGTSTGVGIVAEIPAAANLAVEDRAKWGTSRMQRESTGNPWKRSARTDGIVKAIYFAYGPLLFGTDRSGWLGSRAKDNGAIGKWDVFGPLAESSNDLRWKGSRAVDHREVAVIPNFLRQLKLPAPFVRPVGSAVNFSTANTGIHAFTPSASYSPPVGGEIVFQFADGTEYRAPWYVSAPNYEMPHGRSANFRYAPEFVFALDENGFPIFATCALDAVRGNPWGASKPQDANDAHPWGKYSRQLNPGWGVVSPPGPTEPTPGETVIIPVQKVYIVVNEIALVRVDGNVPILASALSISFDCDSWLPQFSATIQESSRDAIMPSPNPVEVLAHVNGSDFRFFVEKITRANTFPKKSVNISGRGIACELDAPFAIASQHTNATDMTAQQIITNALGYSTYDQSWNITDWLVPADTFSLYGTPAEVAANVADASGAVLQAAWNARTLRMLPRYGVTPWDWATAVPEYSIPGAVTQTESLEWVEKPAYNTVYVSGVKNGVLGHVKRTGSAGDLPAPMVTHALITHDDAARQKGIAILGDTGRKAMMQISMPILPGTGVIDVCRFIEFNDGSTTRRGIVRANNISVNWPTVRQTLTVEAAA